MANSLDMDSDNMARRDSVLPVSYGSEFDDSFQHSFVLTTAPGPHSAIHQSHDQINRRFVYRYTLIRILKRLQLNLRYRDSEPFVKMGNGWGLNLCSGDQWLDDVNLLEPRIEFQPTPDGGEADSGSEVVTLVTGQGANRWIYLRKREPAFSLEVQLLDDGMLLPLRLKFSNKIVEFNYRFKSTETIEECRLLSLTWQGKQFSIFMAEVNGSELVDVLSLNDISTGQSLGRWHVKYNNSREYVRLAKVSYSVEDVQPDYVLQFKYRIDMITQDHKALTSVWQEEGLPVNLPLPQDFRLRNHPGLSIKKLFDQDLLPDLIDTSAPIDPKHPQIFPIWRWSQDTKSWQEGSDQYPIPKPFYFSRENRVPAGTSFNSLSCVPQEKSRRTKLFSSIIVSGYQPEIEADPAKPDTAFRYDKNTFFPNMHLEVHQGGWVDLPDADIKALALPVPLQFEHPRWPANRTGFKRAEGGPFNQAVKILPNPDKTGRTLIFYSAIQFVDRVTEESLLAPHRSQFCQNRRFRYTELWDGVREVDHYLCQAVWRSRQSEWYVGTAPSDIETSAFWERIDLEGGESNGKWVLPWNHDEEPSFYFHYQAFRNVQFVTIEQGLYAIIRGIGIHSPDQPESHRPEAHHFYRLNPSGEWRPVLSDNPKYLPQEFWSRDRSMFVDIDGDGSDEILIPRLGNRVSVFKFKKRIGWRESPDLKFPVGITPFSSSVRLWPLGGGKGKGLDIYQDRGPNIPPRVFRNKGLPSSQDLIHMTHFTNEQGDLVEVES